MVWGPSTAVIRAIFGCLALSAGGTWLLQALHQFVTIDWSNAWRYDAAVDHRAAQLFWLGISPYSPQGLQMVGVSAFGHPPTTAFWFLPLAHFDHAAMSQVIALTNFALLTALVAVSVFTLRLPLPFITTLAIVGFVQNSAPNFDHNQLVQLSVAIAFGVVLAWKLLRENKDWSGGAVLGLVCTLKPFPWPLVLLLLLRGRFRAVLAAVASFVAVAAVMTSRFGLDSWRLFLSQQEGVAAQWIDTVRNASLQGVVRRLVRDRCGVNVLGESTLRWLTLGACVILLVACAWLALRALRAKPDTPTFDRAYALFATLGTFINPWVWEHYVFVLILPMLVSVRALSDLYLESFQAWVGGAISHLRQAASTILIGVGFLVLLACVRWTQVTLWVNSRATGEYCGYQGSPEVKAWLLGRARYFELTSWLPWALTIALLAIVMSFPRRPDGRAPAQSGTGAP
jgi:hypothetical protein